ATGMSSETIIFDATWTDGDGDHTKRLVARIAPDASDVPVFPSYDMAKQARCISLVGELTDVAVPRVIGWDGHGNVIGAPFFVMERIDGVVPPDVMPYTFGDNWLYDATADQQSRLADSTLEVLARLHAIDEPEQTFDFLAHTGDGTTPLRRHVAHTRAWYEYAASGGVRSELVERAFRWLDDHWPSDEGPTVLSWGDARIGNVMYSDFTPVAVLDWEMAGLGPRELDVSWLLFAHQVFEHLAALLGASGMPAFLTEDEVLTTYEQLTGHTPRDLGFYLAYAAVQWGIVFLRTGARSVHFGERPMPDDPEEFMHHRDLFEATIR
ncbi:MAG: phosphotransferase family protein, partial [Actinomycetota bacterium]